MAPFDQDVQAALRAHLPAFIGTNPFRRYGAHAVGIGVRLRGGRATDELSLRVYVSSKLPLDDVPVERRVPSSVRVVTPVGRREVDVPTDVIVEPVPRLALPDPGDEFRPVPGGVSGAVPTFFGTGTLGGWALDTTDETVVILSNAHVLGPVAGAEIIQPGTADGGTPGADRIGSVKRSIAVMPGSDPPVPADCNLVDAAIGMADDPDLIDLTVLEVGPAIYATESAAIGMSVQKYGQTTELTNGTVDDVDYAFAIPFPFVGGTQDAVFCDQIHIVDADGPAGFISYGDSGSVVFRADVESLKPAVGLAFATAGSAGVANKIENVFAALDLDVLCASGYPSYLDGLAAGEEQHVPHVAATRFTSAERRKRAAGRRTSGLARDVQRRLRGSKEGQAMVDFLDTHRHEILSALIRSSDARRAVTAALEPVLKGKLTSREVLDHEIDRSDVARIARVVKAIEGDGSKELLRDFKRLAISSEDAAGKSVAKLVEID